MPSVWKPPPVYKPSHAGRRKQGGAPPFFYKVGRDTFTPTPPHPKKEKKL